MKIDNLDHRLNLDGPEKKKISFRKKERMVKPDSVEISNKAKTPQDQKGKIGKATKSEGMGANYSVYAKKIEQIKINLSSGLYKKQEYKEKTIDKLIGSEEFKGVVYNIDSLKQTNFTKNKTEKIKQIKYKLATGFYNKSEVLERIAEKLIKEFDFE